MVSSKNSLLFVAPSRTLSGSVKPASVGIDRGLFVGTACGPLSSSAPSVPVRRFSCEAMPRIRATINSCEIVSGFLFQNSIYKAFSLEVATVTFDPVRLLD